MKRKTVACFLLIGTAISTPAFGATITVGSGESIQNAVNRAQSGDEIVVDDGTYSAFEIRKNGITVRARNPGGAHVVATGGNQPAIAAYSQSNIAVKGFRLTSRNGDGVKIGGDASGPLAKNIVFEGNVTEYAKLDGFKFFHADGITMRNNVIRMAGGGGAAGSSGNSNGDGGIDWVRVSNSLMEGNTVQQTNGWACAMVKNGSNNNRIVNNRFQNCEVNGIDMAAGSSGRSAAANTSGMTAYNNTIEGNTVDGGKGCAVKFGQKTRGNQLADNDINGRQCDKGTGNNGVAEGADDEVGADGDDMASDGDGNYGGDESYYEEGGWQDDGWSESSGMTAQLVADNGGGAGGGCDSTLANAASGAATSFGVISSITGRATDGLQVAQQIQLLAQTLCDTEQTALQGDQLSEQQKMTARLGTNAAASVRGAERNARRALGNTDSGLYGGNANTVLEDRYQNGMGDGWTYQNSEEHMELMRARTNLATQEAAIAQAAARASMDSILTDADEALALSQGSQGQTQVMMAQTQMMRAQLGAEATKQAADAANATAQLRTIEEQRAQDVIAKQKIDRFYGPGSSTPVRATGRSLFE